MTKLAPWAAMPAVAILLALGALPAQAVAQDTAPYGRSILALLPVQEAPLAVGSEVAGTLTGDEYFTTNGTLVRAYRMEGGQGDPVTIDLISDDFDAYLYLLGPGLEDPASDDDSGGACHARLSLFLPADGPFLVVVGSWGDAGDFTLTVGARERAVAEGDCGGGPLGGDPFDEELLESLVALEPLGTLEPGATTGELTVEDPDLPNDTKADAWLLSGEPGRVLVVDLVSQDFDAYLYALTPGAEEYASDDDSAGSCNSRLRVTLGDDGTRLVVASSLGYGLGTYRIRVGDRAGPTEPGYCGDEQLDVR